MYKKLFLLILFFNFIYADINESDWRVKGAISAFNEENNEIKILALEKLKYSKTTKLPIEEVAKFLDSKDERLKEVAIGVLRNYGKKTLKYIPKLIELYQFEKYQSSILFTTISEIPFSLGEVEKLLFFIDDLILKLDYKIIEKFEKKKNIFCTPIKRDVDECRKYIKSTLKDDGVIDNQEKEYLKFIDYIDLKEKILLLLITDKHIDDILQGYNVKYKELKLENIYNFLDSNNGYKIEFVFKILNRVDKIPDKLVSKVIKFTIADKYKSIEVFKKLSFYQIEPFLDKILDSLNGKKDEFGFGTNSVSNRFKIIEILIDKNFQFDLKIVTKLFYRALFEGFFDGDEREKQIKRLILKIENKLKPLVPSLEKQLDSNITNESESAFNLLLLLEEKQIICQNSFKLMNDYAFDKAIKNIDCNLTKDYGKKFLNLINKTNNLKEQLNIIDLVEKEKIYDKNFINTILDNNKTEIKLRAIELIYKTNDSSYIDKLFEMLLKSIIMRKIDSIIDNIEIRHAVTKVIYKLKDKLTYNQILKIKKCVKLCKNVNFKLEIIPFLKFLDDEEVNSYLDDILDDMLLNNMFSNGFLTLALTNEFILFKLKEQQKILNFFTKKVIHYKVSDKKDDVNKISSFKFLVNGLLENSIKENNFTYFENNIFNTFLKTNHYILFDILEVIPKPYFDKYAKKVLDTNFEKYKYKYLMNFYKIGEISYPYIFNNLDDLLNNKVSFVDTIKILIKKHKLKGKEYKNKVISLLANNYELFNKKLFSRSSVGNYILKKFAPIDYRGVILLLNQIYFDYYKYNEHHFLAYYLSGGNKEANIINRYLARFDEKVKTKLPNKEAVEVLKTFDKAFDFTKTLPRVREDLSKRIIEVSRDSHLNINDLSLLESLAKKLKSANSSNVGTLENIIYQIKLLDKIKKSALNISQVLFIHLSIWMILIYLYPKNRVIQSIVLKKKWLRKLYGFGYIGFLLTHISFLRNRLLMPFKPELQQSAKLEEFKNEKYFSDIYVENEIENKKLIDISVRDRNKAIVIEGVSGSGKSMFLRYLIKNSNRTSLFLNARECSSGVIETIQKRLDELAEDIEFLKEIIRLKGLDIYIDGLNEVDPDTRVLIYEFAKNFPKANIIMTTQPIKSLEKQPLIIYRIIPLNEEDIKNFLLYDKESIANENSIDLNKYEDNCNNLFEITFKRMKKETIETISNMMDLTTIKELLARDEKPNILSLQKQQYELMLKEYEFRNQNRRFPIEKFSKIAFEMKKSDNAILDISEFFDELDSLLEFKMVIIELKNDENIYKFRHDKIWDFFIAKYFDFNRDEILNYIEDERFYSVYNFLAHLLSLQEAKELREKIIDNAMDREDYTLMKMYAKELRIISKLEKINFN